MKFFTKTTAFFAIMCSFLAFSACSDDSPSPVSCDSPIDNLSKDEKEQATTVNSNGDTVIVIHDTVYDTDGNEITYYSEGVFCWTEECEKKYVSSSSKATASSASKPSSSSSNKAVVTISSSSAVPATTDLAKGTMTDNRDKNVYKIEKIGSTVWMSENLKFKTSSGTVCSEIIDGNTCDIYGMYYIYSAAKGACPGGWRLPSRSEVDAVLEIKDLDENLDWWTLGGRHKIENGKTDFAQSGDIGYIWFTKDSDGKSSIQYQSNSVMYLSQEDRYYNVRCVMN